MKIVNQNGKPFDPDPAEEWVALASPLAIIGDSRKYEEARRLEELRASCGVDNQPKTITFRRSLPYQFKT